MLCRALDQRLAQAFIHVTWDAGSGPGAGTCQAGVGRQYSEGGGTCSSGPKQGHKNVSVPKGRGEKYNLSLKRFMSLVRKSQDKTSLLPNTFQPTAPLSFLYFLFFFLLTVELFNATYEVRSGC